MTEVLDPAPLIEAAQQAAAAGDYTEAERLLREVAATQELSLRPRGNHSRTVACANVHPRILSVAAGLMMVVSLHAEVTA